VACPLFLFPGAAVVSGAKGGNRWANSMTTSLEKLDALSRQSADT